jgi:pimeloyl-ACP methyl ester carboxylesterase
VPPPRIRYARSGDLSIAYEVRGDGDLDLLLAIGFVSHLEWVRHEPGSQRFRDRLASFSRLLSYDKRGTGLSDPVAAVGTLEERADDLLAVMDAAGSRQAAVMGISEGASIAAIFAAQHPERTRALVLYGATPRPMAAPDFPQGFDPLALTRMLDSLVEEWGEGTAVSFLAPGRAHDPAFVSWLAGLERIGASPGMARQFFEVWVHSDIRDILGSIRAPTLVLHRRGDRLIPFEAGRYLAAHIPGARFVELEGDDHLPIVGDTEPLLAEVQEFLTGTRPPEPVVERVLAAVLFLDVAGSTALAARIGDPAWAATRVAFLTAVRTELSHYSGTEIDVAGDGVFATFTGPARAVRCAVAIERAVESLGLEVRAGVHVGEVQLEDGGAVSGVAVHIGARVMAEAEPGEVLVTGTVKDLVVGSGLQFTDRGTRTLRGVPGSWPLFAVV